MAAEDQKATNLSVQSAVCTPTRPRRKQDDHRETSVRGAAPPPLRFVSYNLLHGGVFSGLTRDDKDLERRFRIVAEELRVLAPDIVALQEASTGRSRGDVAARLGQALAYHHAHGSALDRLFGWRWLNWSIAAMMNFREGPAILSRFPIVEWAVHHLPRSNGFFNPRVLLYATVRTPWGDLGVASTHTSLGCSEVGRVVELMEARRGPRPSVLMGDFNAREDSPALRRLREAGLVDAFRAVNPAVPGFTVGQRVKAPIPTVSGRVDYVFVMPGRNIQGRVLGSRVVLDTPRRLDNSSVLWPSDHYGVLAEVDMFHGAPAPVAPQHDSDRHPREPGTLAGPEEEPSQPATTTGWSCPATSGAVARSRDLPHSRSLTG